MVGVGEPIPGLLVFRKTEANGMTDEQFLDAIWPAIDDANCHAEAFSQITRDMVRVLGAAADYAQTDKGNIMRGKIYQQYENLIGSIYMDPESSPGGHKLLGQAEMRELLLKIMREEVGIALESPDTDFFQAGMDSLQAAQGRRAIMSRLDLASNAVGLNLLYDCGSVTGLSDYLCGNQSDAFTLAANDTDLMPGLVKKYSNIDRTSRNACSSEPRDQSCNQVLVCQAVFSQVGC